MLALLATGTRATAVRNPPPPQILGITQSQSALSSGGTAILAVTARDPQGGALTFTWTATHGALSIPSHGAGISEVTWTAPDCIVPGSPPVKVTVTNQYGLTAEASFAFTVGDGLGVDRQPPFTEGQFQSIDNFSFWDDSTLRYAEPLLFNLSRRIEFDADVELSLSFLSTHAQGSHTLGWMYYDDLVARGYVNAKGFPSPDDDRLNDANNNGIADLHEDIYNLAPPFGSQARPYIGTTRRCSQVFDSQGGLYSQPELAMNGACNPAVSRQVPLADARPGQTNNLIPVDVIGALAVVQTPATGFSDGGLFPRIPNLLEPAAPANGNKGLGHLPFLLTDDDFDKTTFKRLGPVADQSDLAEDGLPDYDVSAYTPDGLLRTRNPDPGITPLDRTVKLGRLNARREIVFFLITYYDATHDPNGDGTVYPCLRKALDGRCTLHLKTSTSVFFSKPGWNLDQDFRGTSPVVQHNTGCPSSPSCEPHWPPSGACRVANTHEWLCGWVQPTTHDLLRTPAYGNLVLPMERSWVDVAGNGNMPHFEVAATTSNQDQWLLGFEDLNGGGDRDFANVLALLQITRLPGTVRSHVISDTPPAPGSHCAISRVRFRKNDMVPPVCRLAPTEPGLTYAIASDCNLCGGGTCQTNPSPTWVSVPFAPGQDEVVMDLPPPSGSQLCWKAQATPSWFGCPYELYDVGIGYELGFVP